MSDLRQCSRQFLIEFIELYRSFPCLWQVKSVEYSDRNKKSQAYEVMIEKYKEIDESANKETVTKKINSLRTVYKKELTKIMKSTKSGAGEDDIYKPTLWYFNLLEFLRDQDKIRKSTNTIDDERYEESEQEYDLEDQSFPATPSSPPPSTPKSGTTSSLTSPSGTFKRRKKSSNNNETDEVMTKISKRLESLQEDSIDRFGKHIADRLRAVHPDQVKFAMKLISDVLFEADMVSLNRHSKIETAEWQLNPPQRFQHSQYFTPETTQQQISKQSTNLHIPHIGTNVQIPQQGNQLACYTQLEIGQQLQLVDHKTTSSEPPNTNFIPSNIQHNPYFSSAHTQQETSQSRISLQATKSIPNIRPDMQFSQQRNQQEHHSLLEIGQQQHISKQLSVDRTTPLSENPNTDSNPPNILEYVSSFKPNENM